LIDHIDYVTDIDFPGNAYYTSLKRPLEHYEKGVVVIEGDKVVRRFLSTSQIMVSILLTEEWLESFRDQLEMRPEGIQVIVAGKEMLKKIVGFNYHQGVMAVGIVPSYSTLDLAVRNAKNPGLAVALDRLESAENTGVIVRNCAACGVDLLIAGETSADPYLRRAVRNSMGNVFGVPVVKSQSLLSTLLTLKNEHGYSIIAAHPNAESISLYSTDLTKNVCIVLGNEGAGISEDILDICDCLVTIPMSSGVDSFNVSCAGAIMLYETNRQRALLI